MTETQATTTGPGIPAAAPPFPLAGLRVLDLSRALSGPYVGRLMSDLGAEVVKVELPDTDISQLFGSRNNGHSGLYVQLNTGKSNVSIDLAVEGAADLLTRLAAQADVVIENFRPGTLDRLGVGYPRLSAGNAGLVMLSVSGFGQWGPESGRQAYAPVLHAESGLLGRQAQVEDAPPRDIAMALADSVTALHGTIAVLAALRLRDRTGTGQHIDMSMFEAMLATDDYIHYSLEDTDIWPARGLIYAAAGGPILVAGDPKFVWSRLRDRAGLRDVDSEGDVDAGPGTGAAPVAPDPAGRFAARAELIREWIESHVDRAQLVAELERVGLAWAEVRTPATVMQSPTAAARDIVAQVDDRAGGTRPVIRTPYRFSSASCEPRAGAAYVGEHNRDVLAAWLGLDDDDVDELSSGGVLLTPAEGGKRS